MRMTPNRILQIAVALAVALALGACSRTVVVAPGPSAEPETRGPSTAATLGIPPGHLPPLGKCRVWVPGRPPGHQSAPGSCSSLAKRVPAGGWLVYRPSKDRKRVEVSVYHERRPGVVVVIRHFEAASGRLLKEEKP